MINLDRLDPADRAAVERELAVLMRAEDGAFRSTTLRGLLERRATGKTVFTRDGAAIRGVLIEWPGYEQPQVMEVGDALWESLTLPERECPDWLA